MQQVYETKMRIFNTLFFDMSQFYWLSVSNDFTVYRPGEIDFQTNKKGGFQYLLTQGKAVMQVTHTVKSLNLVVA